jgi:urease accessory protein
MHLDPSNLLRLLQWTDSAFPTGAFAQSGGLETETQSGAISTPADLLAWIAAKLDNAASTDLIIVHIAMAAYQQNDTEQLIYLDELCAASKIAQETRQASEKVGKRMLENVLNLLPDAGLSAYRSLIAEGRAFGHHAVVHGLVCAAAGIEPPIALLAFAYGMVANQASAALKLMSIGQTQTQAVIGQSHQAIEKSVAAALARTLADFGSFAGYSCHAA